MNQILKYKALKMVKKTTVIRKKAEGILYKRHLTALFSNFPFIYLIEILSHEKKRIMVTHFKGCYNF